MPSVTRAVSPSLVAAERARARRLRVPLIPAPLDKTIVSQCTARLLGGFEEENDLKKIQKSISYPVDVHNPQLEHVPGPPDELHHPEKGPIPVQKHVDENGNTVGSEWIYSDDAGRRERRDTSTLQMQATHHGAQGKGLKSPDYG